MKILFVLSEYLPESGGGIISYYQGILPYLVEAGHEIHVLVGRADLMDRPSHEREGVRVSYLKSEFFRNAVRGFERYHVGFPTLWAFLPFAWAAFEQTKHGEGYDLVETTDFPLLFAPWAVAADAPPINISLHGSCGQLEWHEHREALSLDIDLVRLVERAAFSSALGVQANSDTNARFWQKMTNREIEVLLPSSSPFEALVVRQEDRQAGVVVGRLQNWKGPRVLCEALQVLPKVQVLWMGKDVIGRSTGMPMSKTLETEYPRIFGSQLIYQGGVSHEVALEKIADASFLCVPSTWDVFNLSVVEAMSLGTPVICSLEAGASMLIRHAENGFLFDPGKPEELAECIRRVQSLTLAERAHLVERAHQTVLQRLDPGRLCTERLDYYKTVVSRPRCGHRDEWLQSALAPRMEGSDRTEILQAFSKKELLRAVGRQMVNGIKHRISSG